MQRFSLEQIDKIRDLLNLHLSGVVVVGSIELKVSDPMFIFGDVRGTTEELIRYDGFIYIVGGDPIELHGCDLTENVRDAASLLFDEVQKNIN